VRVLAVRAHPFAVPLRTPLETASTRLDARRGLLLEADTDAGVTGVGEASPWPPVTATRLVSALPGIEQWCGGLGGAQCTAPLRRPPRAVGAQRAAPLPDVAFRLPLQCAVEAALLDAVSRSAGVPLARWLDSEAADRVPVNALVSARDPDRAAAEAAAAVAAGFGTVKLKVGTAPSAAAEEARVAAVRAALGAAPRLRLDANGAWTEPEAIALLGRLERFDLELVEQPVAAADLGALARVRRSVGVAVAADEAVTGVDAARLLVAAAAADVLVVKPMVVGGLGAAREIAAVARAAGLGVVVTTTVDAGVGTAAALHLAASLGESPLAHGLATAGLLASDLLVEPIAIRGGLMAVPAGPGLGVEVDWGAVRRHRVRVREEA